MKKLLMLSLCLFAFIFSSNLATAQTFNNYKLNNPQLKTQTNPTFSNYNKTQFELNKPSKEIEIPHLKEEPIPNQYVIILNPEIFPSFLDVIKDEQFRSREEQLKAFRNHEEKMTQKVMELTKEMGIYPQQMQGVFAGAISGFSAEMSQGQAKELTEFARKSEFIKAIAQDMEVALDGVEQPETIVEAPTEEDFFAQNTPWGVRFVGTGDGSRLINWAFVIDTGVDLDHRDLNVSRGWSRSYVGSEPSADDTNGHGTHVAGTIAAKNNGFGVVGVAAGATVVSVKVLRRDGKGAWSDMLRGVSYVGAVAWRGDVVNMSVGGPKSNWWQNLWGDARPAMEDCVRRIGRRGVFVSIAAGNEADHANDHTPARVNGTNVYTVSNMTSARRLANDSNYGNGPVDYAAPGSGIYSTYMGNRYGTMSGTSMAAPHVAGILLLNGGFVRTRGRLVWDRDGNPDRIAVLR